MKHNLVDSFLSALTNPFLAKIIKPFLQLSFITAEIKTEYIVNPDEIDPKRIERSEEFQRRLFQVVVDLRERGLSKNDIIITIQEEFQKYKITYKRLPRAIYDCWEKIER